MGEIVIARNGRGSFNRTSEASKVDERAYGFLREGASIAPQRHRKRLHVPATQGRTKLQSHLRGIESCCLRAKARPGHGFNRTSEASKVLRRPARCAGVKASIAPQRHRKLVLATSPQAGEYRFNRTSEASKEMLVEHGEPTAHVLQSHLRGIEREPVRLVDFAQQPLQSHLRGIERDHAACARDGRAASIAPQRHRKWVEGEVVVFALSELQSHLRGIESG